MPGGEVAPMIQHPIGETPVIRRTPALISTMMKKTCLMVLECSLIIMNYSTMAGNKSEIVSSSLTPAKTLQSIIHASIVSVKNNNLRIYMCTLSTLFYSFIKCINCSGAAVIFCL